MAFEDLLKIPFATHGTSTICLRDVTYNETAAGYMYRRIKALATKIQGADNRSFNAPAPLFAYRKKNDVICSCASVAIDNNTIYIKLLFPDNSERLRYFQIPVNRTEDAQALDFYYFLGVIDTEAHDIILFDITQAKVVQDSYKEIEKGSGAFTITKWNGERQTILVERRSVVVGVTRSKLVGKYFISTDTDPTVTDVITFLGEWENFLYKNGARSIHRGTDLETSSLISDHAGLTDLTFKPYTVADLNNDIADGKFYNHKLYYCDHNQNEEDDTMKGMEIKDLVISKIDPAIIQAEAQTIATALGYRMSKQDDKIVLYKINDVGNSVVLDEKTVGGLLAEEYKKEYSAISNGATAKGMCMMLVQDWSIIESLTIVKKK